MKKIKVLMNHTGSQAIDIINLLHEKDIYVIYLGNLENNELLEKIADEFYKEESFKDIESYVEYLLNICIDKDIDVFIPFRKMEELAKYKYMFDKIGIKTLIPDNIDTFITLNNKIKTYELLKDVVPEIIPEYYSVNSYSEFVDACENLRNKNKEVCMKYVTDIASNSFRIINFKKHSLNELDVKSNKQKSKLSHMINYEDIKEAISSENLKQELIVMEYMDGNEVSCDCLKTNKENIIIPRIKINSKTQLITNDKTIVSYCNKILNSIDYNTPCNIQFKMAGNNPMLLEINTRMSGGVMISSWATNINIPLLAVEQIYGNEIEFDNNWKDVKMINRISYDKMFI